MKRKYKLLIVEDNEFVLHALYDYFSEYFDVSSASNGIEAIETIKEMGASEIDIVITDIIMPGMDGLELSRFIKKNYPNIPVIVTTGYDKKLSRAERATTDAFFKKPFDLMDMYYKILELLQK